ncbi:signal protein [Amphibiibacter pelophylacis]|uniref:Signal protein n=1 Tax=Amphibiibacter pelophylacis TaxID=1799477 RepID=A0ACC6P034_9BURK
MKKTLFALIAGIALTGTALAQTAMAPAKDAAMTKPAAMAPAAPAAPTAAPKAAPSKMAAKTAPATAPAAGGGDGKVWVNGKVFHCEGTKYYGKTKKGEYMTLADAKAKGAHVAKGQTCDK